MARPSREELRRRGRALRDACPRSSHAGWRPSPNRSDPIELLRRSNRGRISELVPVRHGRMLTSPLAFYRGAALNMAADLARTPVTGVRVQACGDCHLSNFGAFATPERRVIVDINDLDETLPAPWEWDLERLATSFVLASRQNGHGRRDARDAALACVRAYRERMAELSELRVLDVWYANTVVENVISQIDDAVSRVRLRRRLQRARARSIRFDDYVHLVTTDDGSPRIKEAPPLIVRPSGRRREAYDAIVQQAFASYGRSLPEHRRRLLERFEEINHT